MCCKENSRTASYIKQTNAEYHNYSTAKSPSPGSTVLLIPMGEKSTGNYPGITAPKHHAILRFKTAACKHLTCLANKTATPGNLPTSHMPTAYLCTTLCLKPLITVPHAFSPNKRQLPQAPIYQMPSRQILRPGNTIYEHLACLAHTIKERLPHASATPEPQASPEYKSAA